jgi:hypothetical protein
MAGQEEEEEEEEEAEVDGQTGCARGITTRHPPRWRRRTCSPQGCFAGRRFTVAAFQPAEQPYGIRDDL